ncbi:MAG: hypothetical protein HRU29_05485 [Rhizobiales bacterium]|nr:hypothetical protein [Hyphomicrobiales bacterium]NRB13836.1 hypothetical protein [Hyphomicrobiales bacterium]
MSVTLSKAVRQNLQAMQSTAKMMADTQNRLATGKKVNSALDNPTNFFTASALDSRASDLSLLMDSVGNAVKTLEAADNGVKAIQKLVESAQGTARQALQAPQKSEAVTGVKGTTTGTDMSGYTDNDLGVAETITFKVGGGSEVTVAFADGTQDTLANIATQLSTGAGISAAVVSNKLVITADNEGDSIEITSTGTATLSAVGLSAGTSTDQVTAVAATDNATRTSLEAQFKETMDQIDQLTQDAGFNGNNFLDSDDLKITFNEDGSSSMTIKGADTSSSGLGLTSPAAGDFQDDVKIEAVLKSLDTATTSLRSSASTFGSNLSIVQTRQDFTENMINTLESGAANLTMADLNQEGANMLALQTRQSLATTALSMASRADQSILSLLR